MVIMDRIFETEEFMKLSRDLEKHHAVFYRLWNLGKPIFTDEVVTAAASFDRLGESVNFLINPEFWDKLSWPEKQFTICHEGLHVILNHGIRIKDLQSDPHLVNMALDVVVNHSLVERFGFDRAEVDPKNEYCWNDTVFDAKDQAPTDKSFEFYYNLLVTNKQTQKTPNGAASGGGQGGKVLDDHSHMDDFEKVIQKLNEELSEQEKEALKSTIQKHFMENAPAGTQAGNLWVFANVGKVVKKKKWETVIKQWARKHMNDKDEEQWSRMNRRLVCLGDELILPSDAEIDSSEKSKIDVIFMQDTSGSCYHFRDRFFKAAASIPTDRFNISLCCFDTRVFETSLAEKKLYGFGGTSYSCIERYIQDYMRKHNKKYPDAIFCITDGFGDYVNPEKPRNWYWFLSTNYTSYVPKESKVFLLKDFE